MSHRLMNRQHRDRTAPPDSIPTGAQISRYVSGLHHHMVQTAQPWRQTASNAGLVRHETQYSRYLANFSSSEG
ncbi:hypothetical protein [Halomicronema sp. CCY15110]|uniref:hypothetical protein n=1 Tax=Halomicronema sp. CCY15110 TaxID=2767773 RepID=UPI0019506124|nr:hypothetical protein [Halomicronema sp. CCY15110]